MSGILKVRARCQGSWGYGQGVRDPEGTGKVSGILRLGQGVRDPEGTGKVSGILRVRARCQGS